MKKNLNILAAEEHVDDGDPKVLRDVRPANTVSLRKGLP